MEYALLMTISFLDSVITSQIDRYRGVGIHFLIQCEHV